METNTWHEGDSMTRAAWNAPVATISTKTKKTKKMEWCGFLWQAFIHVPHVENMKGRITWRKIRMWSRKMISLIKYDCVCLSKEAFISHRKVTGRELVGLLHWKYMDVFIAVYTCMHVDIKEEKCLKWTVSRRRSSRSVSPVLPSTGLDLLPGSGMFMWLGTQTEVSDYGLNFRGEDQGKWMNSFCLSEDQSFGKNTETPINGPSDCGLGVSQWLDW